MYAELYCQSNYSFLQGASHPEELVYEAARLGYQSIAITDECSMAGVVKAYTAIKEHRLPIQLIVGSLLHIDNQLSLIALCPNRRAYAELCRVISNARRRAAKNHYAISQWDLASLKQCLIIWLPSPQNEDDSWGIWLKKRHGNRLWIGATRHLQNRDHQYISSAQHLSKKLDIPLTACGGVLMHCAQRLPLQHVLSARRLGTTIDKAGRQLLSNAERCLRPVAKLKRLFPSELLQESLNIANRCRFDLSELRYEYPTEIIPPHHTAISYLRDRVAEGCNKRFGKCPPEDISRTIEKELALIEELDYAHFFLTIDDIVQFARRNNILYQGRGSAANSVVCYCLEITAVDPRHIEALFERFISKERCEPPDIDVDFEHQRREEVIQYIYQKYGRERAALAATVISYRFKSALKDVGKTLGFSETQVNFFTQNIDTRDKYHSWQEQLMTLGVNRDAQASQHLIRLTQELMGFPRHLSQHVGGFVISRGPLYELVPIENAAMAERTVIQWDKDDLESLGLLKVDVLALGMLSAIRKTLELIKTHHHQNLSLAQITAQMNDQNVYADMHKADTVGVFQIESRAQMTMLPRLKPRTYYDLVIQIAIVRPGPIKGGMVTPYLNRRQGLETPSYPSATLKKVLQRTLGVPIFQEQVIKLAMVAAGFTGGEADQLRRAMGSWGKSGKLLAFRDKLVRGMIARGYQEAFAEQLFEQILGFGEYGFPESHSASFALLAYASAWLKHYYPAAFYCALLNSQPMGFYSASQLCQDAQRHDCPILPVCVNHSQFDHTLEATERGLGVRLGFCQVKGFSPQDGDTLVTQRKRPFTQIQQIAELGLDHTSLNALASANAFACFKDNRYKARWALMEQRRSGLFSEPSRSTLNTEPGIKDELLEDYQSLGLSLELHPIELLESEGLLDAFTHAADLRQCRHGAVVAVAGVVTGRQRPGTAGGITFMTLEDHTGNSNVIVWAATASAQKKAFYASRLLFIKGTVEHAEGVTHVIAGKLTDISHCLEKLNSRSRDFH
ncbi:error-prone DNA polymerase [Gilvimarinus sp. HB14]|uniref:Error-prone DNA polymerase n=2 Tax=Gilvimarinus xylanilyticus TaxID=2944139 RepID=A0A9X2I316_9GAMM|nr:error-prone DNA polymerase [Gilvimarinus xylanilyticus]MCP8898597.1 error-prone DNA polymerase [Gilvimarinus xylanilyticus]